MGDRRCDMITDVLSWVVNKKNGHSGDCLEKSMIPKRACIIRDLKWSDS